MLKSARWQMEHCDANSSVLSMPAMLIQLQIMLWQIMQHDSPSTILLILIHFPPPPEHPCSQFLFSYVSWT